MSKRGKRDFPDEKDHDFAKDGFNYRTDYFMDEDGEYYRLTVSVGKNGAINSIYSVGLMKKTELPFLMAQGPSGVTADGSSYNNATTNDGKSQEKIIYSDGEVKNTPFADALAGIDTDSLFNNVENDTQHAMPVSGTEAGVGADNIIAPADKIAQIPTANRKMLNVWSKRTGAKILIADTGAKFGQESAGAYSRSDDTIVIDWKTAKDSEAFARKILSHEGVHSVESSDFYNELRDYAFSNLYANDDAKNKAVTDKINEYGKEGVTLDDAGAEKELVADYLSEHILSSEKAINNFCRQNPSLAKNVYWSLKKAYAYLTNEEKFEEIKNIEKGLEIFEKALNTRAIGEDDIQFSSPVASAEVDAESDVKIKSNKAKNYYDRYVRTAKRDFGKLLSIPRSRLGVIDGNIDTLAGEYFHTGKISDSSKEALFEKAWSEGVIVDDTNTDFAKALRKDLKSSKLYISPEDAKDIPDFGAWKNKQLGNMILSTKEGYSVDSKYQELNEEYGDNYFPLNITSPSDRLLRIAEVMDKLKPVEYTLDEREGAHKEEYRKEFMKGLGEFEKRLADVSRYEKARELAEQPSLYGREELTIDEANSTYAALKEARKNYDKVMAKELLTPNEQKKVELVLAGELDIDDIKGSKINVEGIKRVVEAKAPIKLLTDSLDKHKAAIKKKRFETAKKFLKGSDFWKEKKTGLSYASNTMERTIYDIMGKGSEKQAKEFIDHYFTPVHEHEAQSIRNKNNYRQRVANLRLSQKIEKGNKTSESFAVQFLGEVESDLEMLTKRKYISEKTKAKINELKKQEEIFLRENPNLDYDKINNAISEFRKMYDELFVKMNEARIRNGYAPVEYRQGYFPHFLTDAKKGIRKELAQ